MKYMVTGGNRGLGLEICKHYGGDSYSRTTTGHNIIANRNELAKISLDYDVFVNIAFDGPFQETWADFGQVKLLFEVADLWQKQNKSGWIINIGSSGSEDVVAPEPSWETYRVNKVALKHHSLQWTRAFKLDQVQFRTSLLTVDRLDTELSRSRSTWTGNGVDLSNVISMIDLCLQTKNNTCIGEISAWVNLDHKQ